MRRLTSVLLGGAALAFLSSAAVAEDKLTVVSWGGAYAQIQEDTFHKPWSAISGVPIQMVDYNGGLAEVKAMVEAGNPSWDVVDVSISDAVRGCEDGLFERLDLADLPKGDDGTPADQDFLPGTLQDCGVATIVWSTAYAYDASKFAGAKPTTIVDFFDTKTFPGKRGMRKVPQGTLEFALMADGVPPEQVYEVLATDEGVARAFARLDSIKGDIIFWEAGAQPPQMLNDGQVVMTTAFANRIFNAAVDEGKPFEVVWDGQVWDIDLYVIVKGSPHKEQAWDFIKFATSTQPLAAQAAFQPLGPARQSSIVLIGNHATGIDMKQHMPTTPEHMAKALQTDFQFWADHQDELNEKFNAWLAR